MEEDNTLETITDDADVTSTDGEEAVEGNPSEDNSIAKTLSEVLGKEFKDDATALKAVKDTFSYVGKKREQVAEEVKNEVDTSNLVTKEQYLNDMFYAKNPQHEPLRDVIDSMAKAKGQSVAEVIESDPYKKVFESHTGYQESQSAKSVLETNPTLGKVRNKLDEARDAVAKGNYKAAEKSAVSAVLDAYPDKE